LKRNITVFLASFLISFGIATVMVEVFDLQVEINGFHFHHSYLGLILIGISPLFLRMRRRIGKYITSGLLGFGSGAILHHLITEGFILFPGII